MPPRAVLSSCVGYSLTALTAAKPSLPFCTVQLIQALCWAQQLQQRRQVAEPIPSTQHWLFVLRGCSVLAAHLGKSRLLGALAERSQFPGDVCLYSCRLLLEVLTGTTAQVPLPASTQVCSLVRNLS